MLSKEAGDKEDDPEQPDESDPSFGAGVFTNADQIDGKNHISAKECA